MSLDGKLGILIVTLALLFLIYLDNAGKLYPAMALIAGPAIDDFKSVASAAAPASAAPGTVAPYAPTSIVPIVPGAVGSGALKTMSPSQTTVPGIGTVPIPSVPTLPVTYTI